MTQYTSEYVLMYFYFSEEKGSAVVDALRFLEALLRLHKQNSSESTYSNLK